MKSVWGRCSAPGFVYAFFLLGLCGVYAIWLFPFTLFDGFASLSSDAPSYVLLARKWSPYFEPGIAESLSWPVLAFPPGFPWLLAVTGASGSTYFGHLLVSSALLASIGLIGWLSCLSIGRVHAGVLTVILASLPGAVVHSMGILSENAYLFFSLAVLVLFARFNRTRQGSALFWTTLFLGLSLALLTRTIGIALVGALSLVAVFDHRLPGRQRTAAILVVLTTLAVWQLWGVLDPQSRESSHWTFLLATFGHDGMAVSDRLLNYAGLLRTNAVTLIVSWNHYLSLSLPNEYFFWFSVALLTICISAAALRSLLLQLDALYILLYLGILLIWPFPAEMTRFLHPVIMLLLFQPVLYARAISRATGRLSMTIGMAALLLTVFVHSLVVQAHMHALKQEAGLTYPAIAHSPEFYALPNRRVAEGRSVVFQDVMQLMASSSDIVPEGAVVAAAQNSPFALLSDRPSVMLSTVVSYEQQLCNFMLRDVEYVFLAPVVNTYNMFGLQLRDAYENLTSRIWTMRDGEGNPRAHVLQLDSARIKSALKESSFKCETARDRPIR